MVCTKFLWATMCDNSFTCTLFGKDINCYLLGAFNWTLVIIMAFIAYKVIRNYFKDKFAISEDKEIDTRRNTNGEKYVATGDSADILSEKCGLSVDGKCTGNFSPLRCDGLEVPKECEEMLSSKLESSEGEKK